MVKIMDSQAVAKLHKRFADHVRERVNKAVPDCTAEQREHLEDYVAAYAASYRVSKGHFPQPESLAELAAGDPQAITQAKDDLGKRFLTKKFQEMAQQPAKDHPHHGTLFEESDRLYIPLENQPSNKKGLTEASVTSFLEEAGYTVVDYNKGMATKDGGKNVEKIGKLLSRSGQSDLLDRFSKDGARSKKNAESDLMMVVSRNPEDIAACSTARSWTSCMSEQGCYKDYVQRDIEAGSAVAYLVSTDDPKINTPLARRLLKPYVNEKGETIMMPDNGYGLKHNGFKQQAYDFCAEHFNRGKVGEFKLKKGLYTDCITAFELREDGNYKVIAGQGSADGKEIRKLPDNIRHGDVTIEEILDYQGCEYEHRQDGTLVVDSVDLSYLGLTCLPDMRHVEVGEDFMCDDNQLTSLEGAPQQVGGDFICHNNRLTSLKGATQEVGGDFTCDNNQLKSLEGAPQQVGRDFECKNNQFINLMGAPQKVGGSFNCEANLLINLACAPQEVGGEFLCDQGLKHREQKLPER